MKIFYNNEYVAPDHNFDTTRKAAWIADAIHETGVPGIELVDPACLTGLAEQTIELIHDSEYIDALRTGEPKGLASSQGFVWDEGIWQMALNSTAGVLGAVTESLAAGTASGSLSSGLHHARAGEGSGFCTVNGLAGAARHALGLVEGTVVVLDTDAHCGGGTHSLVGNEERIRHLDLSVNGFDSYVAAGNNQLVLLTKRAGHDGFDHRYLDELDGLLDQIPDDTGLVLYNAGMDPYPSISAAVLTERENRVAGWCVSNNVPVAFVLAGGYTHAMTEDELVELHMKTVRAFSSADPVPSDEGTLAAKEARR